MINTKKNDVIDKVKCSNIRQKINMVRHSFLLILDSSSKYLHNNAITIIVPAKKEGSGVREVNPLIPSDEYLLYGITTEIDSTNKFGTISCMTAPTTNNPITKYNGFFEKLSLKFVTYMYIKNPEKTPI